MEGPLFDSSKLQGLLKGLDEVQRDHSRQIEITAKAVQSINSAITGQLAPLIGKLGQQVESLGQQISSKDNRLARLESLFSEHCQDTEKRVKLLEDRILKANSQLEALGLAYSSKADRIEMERTVRSQTQALVEKHVQHTFNRIDEMEASGSGSLEAAVKKFQVSLQEVKSNQGKSCKRLEKELHERIDHACGASDKMWKERLESLGSSLSIQTIQVEQQRQQLLSLANVQADLKKGQDSARINGASQAEFIRNILAALDSQGRETKQTTNLLETLDAEQKKAFQTTKDMSFQLAGLSLRMDKISVEFDADSKQNQPGTSRMEHQMSFLQSKLKNGLDNLAKRVDRLALNTANSAAASAAAAAAAAATANSFPRPVEQTARLEIISSPSSPPLSESTDDVDVPPKAISKAWEPETHSVSTAALSDVLIVKGSKSGRASVSSRQEAGGNGLQTRSLTAKARVGTGDTQKVHSSPSRKHKNSISISALPSPSLSSRSSGKQAMSATQSRLSRRTKKLEVQVHEQLRQGRMADRKRLSNYSRF